MRARSPTLLAAAAFVSAGARRGRRVFAEAPYTRIPEALGMWMLDGSHRRTFQDRRSRLGPRYRRARAATRR
jgi:hypothetical protein